MHLYRSTLPHYSTIHPPNSKISSLDSMSKALDSFFQEAQALKNAAGKFTANTTEGGRIIPSPPKDADFQLRIDAGRYNPQTHKLNVVLQVNGEAKSPGLQNWAHTTHEQLATASFDTTAADKRAEFERVLEDLRKKAKDNMGKYLAISCTAAVIRCLARIPAFGSFMLAGNINGMMVAPSLLSDAGTAVQCQSPIDLVLSNSSSDIAETTPLLDDQEDHSLESYLKSSAPFPI